MVGPLKKAVVAQFLAAVKSALSYVSELKMAIADDGEVQSGVTEKDALQLYSRVRRLRECLRRWMSTYPEPETLGLDDDDTNLLCSCLVHELSVSEKLADQQNLSTEDRKAWLQRRNAVIHHWLLELATEPIEQLPSRWRRTNVSYDVRQALVAVRDKTTKRPATDAATGIYHLGETQSETLASNESPRIEDDVPIGLQVREVGTPAGGGVPTGAFPVAASIVDSSRIKDYRLRLTMAMDVRAYHRCVGAEDHRLALVLLGMILEGLLLDHALTRKADLGLSGSPSSWPIPELVRHVLDGLDDRSAAMLQILESSSRALRPSSHLDQPFVVNKAMVQEVEAFVAKVSKAIGFVGASGSRPAPRPSGHDPHSPIDPLV